MLAHRRGSPKLGHAFAVGERRIGEQLHPASEIHAGLDTKQKTSSLVPLQKALGHRADLGHGCSRNRVDAGFHLREWLEWLREQHLCVFPRVFHEVISGDDAMDETEGSSLLGAIATALEDDLLGAGWPDEAHEARGRRDAEG